MIYLLNCLIIWFLLANELVDSRLLFNISFMVIYNISSAIWVIWFVGWTRYDFEDAQSKQIRISSVSDLILCLKEPNTWYEKHVKQTRCWKHVFLFIWSFFNFNYLNSNYQTTDQNIAFKQSQTVFQLQTLGVTEVIARDIPVEDSLVQNWEFE